MKRSLFILFFCFSQVLIGQSINGVKIDTSNYYKFYSWGDNLRGKKVTTSFLGLEDVAPVVIDELRKAGYEWLSDFTLFKADSGQYMVLAGYSRKSNFGFYYEEGHPVLLSEQDRSDRIKLLGRISVCEETTSGNPNFVRITHWPENVFVLFQSVYWFQYTENITDNERLITKEIAIEILRQDIRACLAKAPKPTK